MDQQPTMAAEAPEDGRDVSDEARLEEAMQRLKLLHIKARLLRETIPKMIDPLIQKQPSPDIMFAAFMKAVNDAQADVKEFTELMRDDITKDVFDQAAKSREANPMGITPWRHRDHPDWFRMDSKA
ncbi:hypothetical protein BGZ61DRAFT_113503 [Ilyonectria robusta]|uniref:uncharacterized protein n=1 Tax=Ilyonectria robusta TaxID=1079257 RepID=UPI001E8E48A9|nr:uncharacterized protein BGZ61DRAFT_113503 [Ilyonectria robusta]KAH8670011.1 hypothetical protein BGZ61DRAFT_113503 [Ilyonectria robusta]